MIDIADVLVFNNNVTAERHHKSLIEQTNNMIDMIEYGFDERESALILAKEKSIVIAEDMGVDTLIKAKHFTT